MFIRLERHTPHDGIISGLVAATLLAAAFWIAAAFVVRAVL